MKKHNKTTHRFLIGGFLALMSVSPASAFLSWKWRNNNGSTSIRNQIKDSMDVATHRYWLHARNVINYETNVEYDSSVPTANAAYLGRIKFGGSRSRYIAVHECSHVFGVGTYSNWNSFLVSGNKWSGGGANYRYRTLYNQGTDVNADSNHFWNYGFNQGWENVERHVDMVRSFRYDMGLSWRD